MLRSLSTALVLCSIGCFAGQPVVSAFLLLPSTKNENPSPSLIVRSQQRSLRSSPLPLSTSSSGNDGDPVVKLPLMEAELACISSDDPTSDENRKEELQRSIDDAKTAAEFGVRAAQLKFYDAFSSGDLAAMKDIWSTEHHVSCVHPGMSSLEGREAVLSSWEQLFASSPSLSSQTSQDDDDSKSNFDIEPSLSRIDICGLTAFCRCIENTEGGGQLEALNIYKREGGEWKITLHMASPIVMRQGASGAIF